MPMPQMAVGSREQSSALLSCMYGILLFPNTMSEQSDEKRARDKNYVFEMDAVRLMVLLARLYR